MPISRSTSHKGSPRALAAAIAAFISAPGSMPYCSAMRCWNDDSASDANTIPALPVRMTWNRSIFAKASGSRMPRARDSHNSIAMASKGSRSISALTASTEARDTCAVPSNTYSMPSRSTRAMGWSCRGLFSGSTCAFKYCFNLFSQVACLPSFPRKRESSDFKAGHWVPDRRFAASGMTNKVQGTFREGLVAEAFCEIAVSVDPPIAQEGPDAPHGFAARHVDVGNQQFAAVVIGFREDFALRPGDATRSPELRAATFAGCGFETDAVAGEHRHAV